MILVGWEPVWLVTHALIISFACLCFMFFFYLELIAFVLLPSAHGRGEVRPGVSFFVFGSSMLF